MLKINALKKILPLVILMFVFSCKKTKDTTAKVKVVSESGLPIAGASIRLFGEGTIDPDPNQTVGDILLDKTKQTDSKGEAFFDYTEYYKSGQSGFAILNVEIEKIFPDSISTLEGIIKIEEETENTKTFILK